VALVDEQTGLRARKQQRTRQAISDAAISLFLARGFDQVPVADVAAAAEVSKPTLFRYFPTKEDLVLHRIADHQDETARVVRARHPGRPPLTALHHHLRARLDAHDPITGLDDRPHVLAFHALLYSTPTLLARLVHYTTHEETSLTEALREATGAPPEDITPVLLATQVVATHRVLRHTTWQALNRGRTAAEVHPEAVTNANRAYALLKTGAGAPYA
jgi:AcrR family transcriptional regulator